MHREDKVSSPKRSPRATRAKTRLPAAKVAVDTAIADAKLEAAVIPSAAVETSVSTGWGPTPAQRKRRRLLLLLLLLLLLPASFWLGRITLLPQAAPVAVVRVMVPAPTPAVVPVAVPAAASAPAPALPKVAQAVPPAASATIVATPERETTLLEVSVGTSNRGGLTLMFDHPVDWTTENPADGHAELDVEGVRALGTFPRNLPLPPGVKAIHALITAPDILNLKFDLKPGVQAYTFPGNGPAAAVNVYFRTPIEEAASGDTMRSGPDGIPMGAGSCGPSSPAAAKAVTLLQQSLDKNPGYAPVRTALAVLMTCNGNGSQAEQVTADGRAAGSTVKIAVVDAALLYARGDATEAVQVLKSNAPAKADHGYDELLADLTAATE